MVSQGQAVIAPAPRGVKRRGKSLFSQDHSRVAPPTLVNNPGEGSPARQVYQKWFWSV
jgi:hypothetical protein